MTNYTPQQARYFAEQVLLKRPQSSFESIASAMSGVKVDLNPHQVNAAMFAVKSPLSNGAILANEVGLGKTIEAGLVLAQYWAERRRKILLIVPASLRMQWRQELEDKFYIDSILMESKEFNLQRKGGVRNPFEVPNKVVICSYDFAARKASDIKTINWDLVIMDEAHRLRNVHKTSNVTGNKLKESLRGRKKLLLTATPLQNNLMELYGLVSIIDDHVFGDAKTFREMYVSVRNTDIRNRNLQSRLQAFCQRTLRSQVTEYVRYTNRIALLQEYTPSEDEEKLYNFISEYLQTDKLYALPEGQRTLITMVLRKLLASSSFAISGTLNSLVDRLNNLLAGIESELDLDRYGQKNEVVVINFLNRKNAADVRVYLLLDQKFRLFSGVFGSSDDVLGSIESGVDFEKRIASIYQNCKTSDEITQEFDELQAEMSDAINEKMTQARQTILENFDEDVTARLKDCKASTVASMDTYTRWLYYFF